MPPRRRHSRRGVRGRCGQVRLGARAPEAHAGQLAGALGAASWGASSPPAPADPLTAALAFSAPRIRSPTSRAALKLCRSRSMIPDCRGFVLSCFVQHLTILREALPMLRSNFKTSVPQLGGESTPSEPEEKHVSGQGGVIIIIIIIIVVVIIIQQIIIIIIIR